MAGLRSSARDGPENERVEGAAETIDTGTSASQQLTGRKSGKAEKRSAQSTAQTCLRIPVARIRNHCPFGSRKGQVSLDQVVFD